MLWFVLQATQEPTGGQRDLLSRPSAPRMARLSPQGGVYGESAERALCPLVSPLPHDLGQFVRVAAFAGQAYGFLLYLGGALVLGEGEAR